MKKLPLFLFSILSFYGLRAQDDSTTTSRKTVPNMATIKTYDGKVLKGWFYQVNDSQMFLLDKGYKYRGAANLANSDKYVPAHTIQIDRIQSLALRRKNSVLKGFLIGLGAGIVTGTVIGLVSGNDPVEAYPDPNNDPYGVGTFFVGLNNSFAMTAGEKAVFGAATLGTLGGITGIIIGAIAKKKFIIGGSKKRVRDLAGELRQRLLIK
jgi:hypothetical protein